MNIYTSDKINKYVIYIVYKIIPVVGQGEGICMYLWYSNDSYPIWVQKGGPSYSPVIIWI